ncbi:BURP domain-containing protein [Klebsiella pneumoniae]|uniref:BURP domain-containing protein n=1 Tax=Klebsiella pneumoniae TaxID=573 RepID=UPI0024803C7B|nr:hypothetical protein [Klebsiella pneumoniae]MDD1107035.1 hypothetical protein [Klebsiella pneumoniae]
MHTNLATAEVTIASNSAAVSEYWHTTLPSTPMPLAILELLSPPAGKTTIDKYGGASFLKGRKMGVHTTKEANINRENIQKADLLWGPSTTDDVEKDNYKWGRPPTTDDIEKDNYKWGRPPTTDGVEKDNYRWGGPSTADDVEKDNYKWGRPPTTDDVEKGNYEWGRPPTTDGVEKDNYKWGGPPTTDDVEKDNYEWGRPPTTDGVEKSNYKSGGPPTTDDVEKGNYKWGGPSTNDNIEKDNYKWGGPPTTDYVEKDNYKWGGPSTKDDGEKDNYKWGGPPRTNDVEKHTYRWNYKWGPPSANDVGKSNYKGGGPPTTEIGESHIGRVNHKHGSMSNNVFLEETLKPGSTITCYVLPSHTSGAPLRRDVADSIPMSTRSFTDILTMFPPASNVMAADIWSTLEQCEKPDALKGERKTCATSVESMVEFVVSVLGVGTHDLRAFSSPDAPAEGIMPARAYKVAVATRVTEAGDTMTCHGGRFPFAVFMCHTLNPTRVYSVTLEAENAGADGTPRKMELLAICHLDTSGFDPARMPLNVKPGDAPLCHFLSRDSIIWAPVGATVAAT